MTPESKLLVPVTWLLLAIATFAISLPRIDDLGLYYDEAFLAQQARGFVEPERAGIHPPSVTTTYIAGRPFPIRNAAYLGSLKSQLLIPSLFAFGSSVVVLRVTTLAIGLLGLLFCMLVAKRWFGGPVAAATGLLIATDPSFHFFSQFEWGPFTTMLLCRSVGLLCLARAFDAEASGNRWIALVCGAAMMGLGVYSRVDFVVILGGFALALLATRPDIVRLAWRDRRSMSITGVVVFVLSILPVLAVVGQVLGAGAGISDRGDLGYRAKVLSSTLDGSHFHRLIEAGGLFDEMFASHAPVTALPVLLSIAAAVVFALGRSRAGSLPSASGFVLLATLLIGGGMLSIPGAVRAHHMLNVVPLAHMIIAVAGVGLWQRQWVSTRSRTIARACVVVALAACLGSNVSSIAATRSLIDETGGVGRFSHALQDFVAELESSADTAQSEVISLDWGFHEIALFTSNTIKLNEPIWTMGSSPRRASRTVILGDASTVYLYHDPPYDLFGFGRKFAAALASSDASRFAIREHLDGRGELVFKSVRFDAPHRISGGGGGDFQIRLSGVASPRPAPAGQP